MPRNEHSTPPTPTKTQTRNPATSKKKSFYPYKDNNPGLHQTASAGIRKWRAVARMAAGDKEDADQLVADFLEQLIDIAQYSPKKPDAQEVQAMFLAYVRIRFFNRFSHILDTAGLASGSRTYDQFEAAMKTYLAA